MTQEVTGCYNCPYAVYWEQAGMHCEHPVYKDFYDTAQEIDDFMEDNIAPEYCPLKMEHVILIFKPIV